MCSVSNAQGESGVSEESSIRAMHFVLRIVALDKALLMVDKASKARINTIQVTLTDGVRLDHSPWKVRDDAWSKRELLAWVLYAKSKGIEVIPEIKLLTHQEKLFQNNFPDLMFNHSTYDPRNNRVYEKVFFLLDEIIELIQPKSIHIGHDEVAGHNSRSRKKWLLRGEPMLPAELFVSDVLNIHGYLKKRGVETWMWGDMLVSPNEFPSMLAKHLHGEAIGYGKAVRDKLPKDIVIIDWHYFDSQQDFPTLDVLQKEGFRVIGSTWKKERTIQSFSRYAAKHGAYGMMATTWWYVQKEEWNVVDRIIKFSGQTFLKDFPDAN